MKTAFVTFVFDDNVICPNIRKSIWLQWISVCLQGTKMRRNELLNIKWIIIAKPV